MKKKTESPLRLYRRLYKAAWKHLRKQYPRIRSGRGKVMSRVSSALVDNILDGEPLPDADQARLYVDLAVVGVPEG